MDHSLFIASPVEGRCKYFNLASVKFTALSLLLSNFDRTWTVRNFVEDIKVWEKLHMNQQVFCIYRHYAVSQGGVLVHNCFETLILMIPSLSFHKWAFLRPKILCWLYWRTLATSPSLSRRILPTFYLPRLNHMKTELQSRAPSVVW